ncbi:MAG: hypothetical protein P4L70_00980 [Parasulfuritortus sp.]|nr:hypothetical protein [Parasulfuritortus sp.]
MRLTRRPDWLLAIALAFLLALTQLGYTLHELHHAVEYVTHTPDDDEAPVEHGKGAHHGHDTCLLCVAYAAMAGGIPSIALPVAAGGFDALPSAPSEVGHQPLHESRYSSRAPPLLLI